MLERDVQSTDSITHLVNLAKNTLADSVLSFLTHEHGRSRACVLLHRHGHGEADIRVYYGSRNAAHRDSR